MTALKRLVVTRAEEERSNFFFVSMWKQEVFDLLPWHLCSVHRCSFILDLLVPGIWKRWREKGMRKRKILWAKHPTVGQYVRNTRIACFKSNMLKSAGCSTFTAINAGSCPEDTDTGIYLMCELQNLKHHKLTNPRKTSPRWRGVFICCSWLVVLGTCSDLRLTLQHWKL